MRFRKFLKRAGVCALMVCAVPILSSLAFGTLITYSSVSGANFNFSNIQEDSTRLTVPVSSETPPVFGQPTGGNSLAFPSLAFKSSATGGMDLGDSKLSMTISSKSSTDGISSLLLSEFGDYTLARQATSSTPLAEAKATGWVTVEEVNGVAISPFIVVPNTTGASFDSKNTMGASELSDVSLPWSGSMSFNIAQALSQNGYTGKATKVDFSMDNSLFTSADAQSMAYIAKKGVTLTVTPMPEPSTLALLSAALFGLGYFGIKRKV